MKIIADTHTHSLACDHAYSTIAENAAAAAARGLRFLALTEHTPSMPGGPSLLYFNNLRALPHILSGVVLLKGAEVNIMDTKGALDLPDSTLEKLDWVIASMHTTNLRPSTTATHTRTWMAVAENPLVDVIGHCGDGRYPFDYPAVVKAFARYNKIIEINAHSFLARVGSRENCPLVARLCAQEGVRIVVSSDAHFSGQVGEFNEALEMLASINFPEELVLNADYGRFLAAARELAGRGTRAYLDTLDAAAE